MGGESNPTPKGTRAGSWVLERLRDRVACGHVSARDGSGREPAVCPQVVSSARLVSRYLSEVLPSLNSNGDLPPGIYRADWIEVERRFGTGTDARKKALATLKRVHELAARTGHLMSLYVFGSFVSAVPEPRDVDVVLVMNRDFRIEDGPSESRALFSHLQAQVRYGASVFWLREGALPQEFMRAWQVKRDGSLRGILEVG